MVLGIITAIAACPAIIATTEAVRQSQRAEARAEHRGRESHLECQLPYPCIESATFNGSQVVLRNGKLYIDTIHSTLGIRTGHPFTGFYNPYPDNQNRWKAAGFKGEGLVSTISNDPPELNWIYVDRNTHEVKYGTKAIAKEHFTGPWDCTIVDHRLTFEGWEGFMAVLENPGSEIDDDAMPSWGLYFDRDDDGLRRKIHNKRIIHVMIMRRETPKTKARAADERSEREKLQRQKEEEAQRQREAAREEAARGRSRDDERESVSTESAHSSSRQSYVEEIDE